MQAFIQVKELVSFAWKRGLHVIRLTYLLTVLPLPVENQVIDASGA